MFVSQSDHCNFGGCGQLYGGYEEWEGMKEKMKGSRERSERKKRRRRVRRGDSRKERKTRRE